MGHRDTSFSATQLSSAHLYAAAQQHANASAAQRLRSSRLFVQVTVSVRETSVHAQLTEVASQAGIASSKLIRGSDLVLLKPFNQTIAGPHSDGHHGERGILASRRDETSPIHREDVPHIV